MQSPNENKNKEENEMKGIILFWRYGGWMEGEERPFQLLVGSKRVCEDLGVSIGSMRNAFEAWAREGCEENFRYEVEPKKWIRIFYNPDFMVLDGSVSVVRPWGNHWRGIGERSYSFSIEAIRI
jgi:hypothetical protein